MERKVALSIGAAVAVLAAGGGIAALAWPDSAAAPLAFQEPAATTAAATSAAAAPAAASTASAAPVVAAAAPESQAPVLPNAPVRTVVTKVGLGASAAGKVDLPQRATTKFSMVSVSWDDPKAAPKGTVQVRTRSAATGAWTDWQSLEVAEAAADRPAEAARVRGRTEPLWAGPSDGVAARVEGATATGLPAGLRLNLIDPDAPPTGGAGGGMLAEPSTPASAAAATPEATKAPVVAKAAMPAMVTRAQWGADEKTVKAPGEVASEGVKVVWVHHSGFGNNETCANSPKILRGIMANDIAEGFDDLGYNFVVDKCGTLYEGRAGSAAKAIIGAHTVGFNTASVGIALLGDYTSLRPSDAALKTISQLAAARLTAYGFDPATTGEMVEGVDGRIWPKGTKVTFPRVSGHKDAERVPTSTASSGYLTACPGNTMYPLLGAIRAKAALPGLALRNVAGTVSAGVTYVRTTATVNWTLTGGNVNRFNILRNGVVVATVAGTARTATVAVPAGSHTIAVRAVHATGVADTTPAVRIVADATPPTFPGAPSVMLRTGTYSATSVPVSVVWRSADNVRVVAQTGKTTSPGSATLAPAATAWNTSVRPNAALTYTITARDLAGNSRAAAATRKVTQVPETSAKRTGTWAARSGSAYLGGKALAASAKNAKLSWTFNGRSAALTFTRTKATGVVYVYVDGTKVATLDTKAATTAYRQTLFVRNMPAKAHTFTIVVAGTAGRPQVIADGLTYAN
ncbi:N-acetylmuramoyl-L-alanine amidase [Actinoplanes sp. NPDC048988]|uniref:N-acetylmuramoyl-L-alanine amidase n=1 Tax=Actinoplanes sp. NPDC048988 TaxID=3363901 RepID=UPI00371BFBCD